MAIFFKRCVFKKVDDSDIGELVKLVKLRLDIEDILYCEECDTDDEYSLIHIRGYGGVYVKDDIMAIHKQINDAQRDENLNLPNRGTFKLLL